MYNINDILAQLQGGQSAESIAQAFADTLNAAIAKQNEEVVKAAARQEKVNWMCDIIEEIIEFVKEFYPELIPADTDLDFSESDVEDLIDELDAAIPQLVQLTSALKGLEDMTKAPVSKLEPIGTAKMTIKAPGKQPATFEVKDADFGAVMTDFFKKNGLM